MTIKQKLALSFVIMIFLVGIVGIFMFYASRMREYYYKNTIDTMSVSTMVKEINFFIQQQLHSVDYFILMEDEEEASRFDKYVVMVRQKFDEWDASAVDAALKQEISALREAYDDATVIAQSLIKTQKKGDRRKAMQIMDKSFVPKEKKLRQHFAQLVEEKTQRAQEAQEKARKIYLQQTSLSLGVIIIAIVLGGVLAWIIFNSIIQPLQELKKGAEAIGSGNFDYTLTIAQKDEFGVLAGSFNEMAENLKKMQAQIIQLDRMSAMGQLAGGVAHELNNPLTGVLGQAQVLLSKIAKDNPMHEQVQKIERAALRCRKIVRELLDFSRQKEYVYQLSDMHELIESTLLLCESDLNASQIQAVKNYGVAIEAISISPPHIQQVFLNIINNAVHAMHPGGILTISTRLLRHGFTIKDRRKEQNDIVVPGKWLEIVFTDTGIGIEEKNIYHVFDPFFTTKDVGKGTGLGLTISYGIVQNHKGTIVTESKGIGKGATFTIRLPYDRGQSIMTGSERRE